MIHYLVTEAHRYTMRRFLQRWGRPLAPRIRIVPHEHVRCFLRGGSLRRRWTRGALRRLVNSAYEHRRAIRPQARLGTAPAGHWIFSDVDRLTPAQREEAALFRAHLLASGAARSVHNDPLRTMGRYEFLRTLKERGLNDFDVVRLTEARRPVRYPVFLRAEDGHAGAETGLLHDAAAFDAALADLDGSGRTREGRLAIGHCAEPDARGLYRKYAAWCIAGRVLPGHLFLGPDWMLKEPQVVDEEALRLERAYLEENPHEAALAEVFRIAGIEYGRADYGVVGGRIQVYEVNSNPGIPSSPSPGPGVHRAAHDAWFNERIQDAFRELDSA